MLKIAQHIKNLTFGLLRFLRLCKNLIISLGFFESIFQTWAYMT